MAGRKRAVGKDVTGRNKSAAVVDKHAEQCTVCKHKERTEIEARFMRYDSGDDLATEFDLSRDAIYRHARYYDLIRKRASNTEQILELLVDKGMEQLKTVDVSVVLDSIRELHKVRGKHQSDKKNDADVERDAEDRKWAEEQLAEYMTKYDVPREQAIEDMKTLAPTVSQWLH